MLLLRKKTIVYKDTCNTLPLLLQAIHIVEDLQKAKTANISISATPKWKCEIVTGTQFDIKKAVIFANHLQNAFTSHSYMEILEHEKRILDTINAPYSKKEFDKINKSEVLNIIKKLKIKKAPAITL